MKLKKTYNTETLITTNHDKHWNQWRATTQVFPKLFGGKQFGSRN